MFVFCATGKRQPQWGDSAGNNRKEQGSNKEEEEEKGRGRLGTQSRSLTNTVQAQGKKKNKDRDDIISQEVPVTSP